MKRNTYRSTPFRSIVEVDLIKLNLYRTLHESNCLILLVMTYTRTYMQTPGPGLILATCNTLPCCSTITLAPCNFIKVSPTSFEDTSNQGFRKLFAHKKLNILHFLSLSKKKGLQTNWNGSFLLEN